jgi:MFS family permease
VIRFVLACYPPSFRERYGAELAALVEDTGAGPRVCWDVAVGAAAAWLRPAFTGEPSERARRRVQAGLSTIWVAWCAGMLAVPVVARALLDPPVPGVTGTVRVLVSAGWLVLLVGGAVAAGCALLLTRWVLVPALRSGRRRVWRPLLPAVVLLALELIGALGVWLLRRGHPTVWPHPSAAFLAALLAWLAGLVALAVVGAAGPPVALRRAGPPARALWLPAVLATGVTAALTALGAVQAAAVLLAGHGPVACGGAAVAVLAAGSALVSTWRTVPALRVIAAD